jgi:catechol 2,3-dioxygenase-like lactoylglutathione lyase family enzyme
MRLHLASVFVDDQRAALGFYTDVLGFQLHHDIPVGDGARWLTVVSPDDPDGAQLLLEPSGRPAVKPYRDASADLTDAGPIVLAARARQPQQGPAGPWSG